MIVLDQPSTPEAHPMASPRTAESRGANDSVSVNGTGRKVSSTNTNSCNGHTGMVMTQVSYGTDDNSTDRCKKLQELLQAFSMATASMVSSKLRKEHAEQRLSELEEGELSADAQQSQCIGGSTSSFWQTSSAARTSICEVQAKLKGCRNSYEYYEKKHAQTIQELAIEMSANSYGHTGTGSVEHLEKKLLDYNLEIRAKDKTIVTLTETVLRLESDFAELWSDLRAIKNSTPSFIWQQQQVCKNKSHDDDNPILSKLSLIKEKQNQLEEQTNLLRDDLEDFRVIETKKFADVSTCENLRSNINSLSEKVETLSTTQCTRSSHPVQEDDDMSKQVSKLATEHEFLKGELKMIQDQTKEKEDFHLERMDDILAEVDDLRNDLNKSYQDRNIVASDSANERNSKLNTPDPRIKEISDAYVELSCKIEHLQSNISSILSSNSQSDSAIQTQEQNKGDSDTLFQLRADVERNGQQSDVLSVAIQSLEKRFNNLTTEEVVDIMVKRVRHLYPNVTAAEEKFAGVFKRLKTIEAKAEETKVSAKDGIAKIQRDMENVQKSNGDVRTWTDAFDRRITRLEGAHSVVRPNALVRNQQVHRDSNTNNKKIIDNKNGKIHTRNTNTPATSNSHLSASCSTCAPISEAPAVEKVETIASQQSRQSALLIRVLKSNIALKMAVNALNAHTRLKVIDWEEMEELKDLKGMKG